MHGGDEADHARRGAGEVLAAALGRCANCLYAKRFARVTRGVDRWGEPGRWLRGGLWRNAGGAGLLQRTSPGGFQLGRLVPRSNDVELVRLAELLGRAIPTKIVDDLSGVRWSKLAINCATSTLGAIGGDTLGRLLAHRLSLVLEVWRELCAVADCELALRLAKVAGTIDIAKLALSDDDKRHSVGSLPLFLKHSILLGIGLKFRRMRSSMAVAIERGRKPEIDWLNGEIVRRGTQHGVATPLNRELVVLVHDLVAKRTKPGLETLYGVYLRLTNGSSVRPCQPHRRFYSAPMTPIRR